MSDVKKFLMEGEEIDFKDEVARGTLDAILLRMNNLIAEVNSIKETLETVVYAEDIDEPIEEEEGEES